MAEIDVNTASKDELLVYAKEELGLKVNHTMRKAEIAGLIAKQVGQSVVADGSSEERELSDTQKKEMKDLRNQPKVRIRIHENPEHPQRIFIGVNGVPFTIKPGVWVDVPASVVSVLGDAVRTTYSQHHDENGNIKTVEHRGLAYPFEVAR